MDFKTSVHNFLKDTDICLHNIDIYKLSIAIVLLQSILINTYLYFSGKFIKYFAKFKNESDFIDIAFESITVAVVEQACLTVYMKTVLIKIIGDRKLARFFTCLFFSGIHVFNLNVCYKIPTIIPHLITSFLMSLIYTKIDPLEAFIINILINVFSVLITYLIWKLIYKTRLFYGKGLVTPILDSSILNQRINSIAKTD
jgi:hypothetical protein